MSKVSGSSMKSSKSEFRKTLDIKTQQQLMNKEDPIKAGSSPTFQWPEWNDSEINKERWDNKMVDGRKKSRSTTTSVTSEICLFEDEPLTLPASLKVSEWKRPSEIFSADSCLVLFHQGYELSVHDLVSVNQHLVRSEFMRSVLAAFLTLWYLGTNDHFPIEGESATFVSNTKHHPWRPWHHIYSLCKAGKNNQHNPQINPCGKYIVRLYFVGCWRKILVDDKIPVDINGKVLLPLTAEKNELWPLLLTKALLKLTCLTWTYDQELVEFNPISCLTGWIVQECDTKRTTIEDVWAMCHSYVKQFSDPYEVSYTETEAEKLETDRDNDSPAQRLMSIVQFSKSTLSGNTGNIVDKKSSKTFGRKQIDKEMSKIKSLKMSSIARNSKNTDKTSSKLFKKLQIGKGVYKEKFLKGSIIATKTRSISNSSPKMGPKTKDSSLRSVKSKSSRFSSGKGGSSKGKNSSVGSQTKAGKKETLPVHGGSNNKGPVLFALMSEHWPMMMNFPTLFECPLSLGHPFLILQTRDSPFVCQKSRPGVPGWKRYRWIDWATKRGIFNPEILLPFRSLQIVSVFSDWFDKIEEKDNLDAPKRLSLESVHASGDTGGSYNAQKIPQNENETTEVEELYGSKIMSSIFNNAGYGKPKKNTKLSKSKSKDSRVSSVHKTQLGGQDSTLSHVSTESDRDDVSEIPEHGAAIWTDFNHIWSGLDKILVFFKPSSYRYKINIANFTFNSDNSTLKKPSLGDKKQEVNATQYLTIPYTPQRSRNDGVYLFFDSVEHAKVLLILCTIPGEKFQSRRNPNKSLKSDQQVSADDTDANEFIPRKNVPPVNVVIEAYNWASNQFNETVLVMETFGSKSATLDLGKGRCILRIWVKTDTVFVLHCLSESTMIAGNRFKIGYAMCTDCETLTSFAQQLRNKLSYMIATFGKQYFANALHATFQTINDISVNQNKAYIHDIFMDAVVVTVKHYVKAGKDFNQYLFALRALFLNVSLGLEKKAKPIEEEIGTKEIGSYSVGESEEKQVIDYDKYTEMDWSPSRTMWVMHPSQEGRYRDSALLIQATWKRYCAIKLLKVHTNTQSKEHKRVIERLRKLREILLKSSAAYGDVILRILNTMVDIEPDMVKWLPLYNDFRFTVKIEDFQGVLVNIAPNKWIPVVRMVVVCHSDTPIIGAVNVVCQIPKYMVRVIDNDNFLEKPRQMFNVEPCMYSKNRNGYTLFVYAWSEAEHKEIQWKLQIVTLKNSPFLHPCTTRGKGEICKVNPPPILMTLDVSNHYIPNSKNVMCRLLISIKRNMLTSFRLSTSFSGVRFTACLQDKDGFPLMHAQAQEGAVIIPAVFLENENNKKETLYIIEAKVIKNSWPLTRQEWIVLERLKNEYVPHKERSAIYKASSGRQLSMTQSKKFDVSKSQFGAKKKKVSPHEYQVMEKPYWTLQTVIDNNQANFITVKQDNRQEEATKAMKKAWKEADPGRAKRGQELRDAFIKETYGTDQQKMSSLRLIQLRESFFGQNQSNMKEFEEDCSERFQNPPEELAIAHSKTHFIKMISKYFVNSGEEPRVKTREDHEGELVEKQQRDHNFTEEHYRDIEERTHIIIEQRRKHRMMNEYYARVRGESKRLMESAYKMRDEYVWKKIEEEKERRRLKALLKKRKKKVKSKQTSKKSSRKSGAKSSRKSGAQSIRKSSAKSSRKSGAKSSRK